MKGNHQPMWLLALCLLLTNTTMAQDKKIIFVCQHGAAKSVIAASYFNKIAKERNLNYVAECRGIEPDSAVSASAKDGLMQDRLFDPTTMPQQLSDADTSATEMIILFTRLPEDWKTSVKTEDWSNTKDLDGSYEQRRDAIVKKINELLDSLQREH